MDNVRSLALLLINVASTGSYLGSGLAGGSTATYEDVGFVLATLPSGTDDSFSAPFTVKVVGGASVKAIGLFLGSVSRKCLQKFAKTEDSQDSLGCASMSPEDAVKAR